MIIDLMDNSRLQEIGQIKIGMKGEKKTSKAGTEFRLPTKLDHFMVTLKQRDSAGNLLIDKSIMDKLGVHPIELNIRLLYDDIELNFLTNYVFYHGKKCLCRGDGSMAKRQTKDGRTEQIKCDRNSCEFAQKDEKGSLQCKPFGKLQVILEQMNIIGGVHVFRTTSWHSLLNIVSSLRFIQSFTGGILAGLPLKMTIQPQTVSPEGTTITTTIYTVNIVYAGEPQKLIDETIKITQARLASGVKLQQIQEQAKRMLLEPVDENEKEIEDIVGEFYPDDVPENGVIEKAAEIKAPEKTSGNVEEIQLPWDENKEPKKEMELF
jgi:hypothetical protein